MAAINAETIIVFFDDPLSVKETTLRTALIGKRMVRKSGRRIVADNTVLTTRKRRKTVETPDDPIKVGGLTGVSR